jgi:hypothetical protein
MDMRGCRSPLCRKALLCTRTCPLGMYGRSCAYSSCCDQVATPHTTLGADGDGRKDQDDILDNKLDRGGHSAAWEQPQLFSEEMRVSFRSLR